MVVVFFNATINAQNAVLQDTEEDHVINVVGPAVVVDLQLHRRRGHRRRGHQRLHQRHGQRDPDAGAARSTRRSQFNLYSPDVIHSFGIPAFLMRMDVVPGRHNHFEVTPDTIGEYRGKCYELCGAYHSRMLFNVKVVSAEDFDQYLRDLQEAGFESEGPVLGGGQAYTQEGLDGGSTSPREARSDRDSSTPDDHERPQAAGPAGGADPHHHRPQADRQALPRHVVRVVPDRRPDGHDHALRARVPRPAGRQRGALQPALHDARHDHAAAVRDAAVLRVRQRRDAAADRLARTSRSRA